MYLNQATIIGNLTRDPELRALPDGTKVASFGVATNESYKNKAGDKVESVEFHNVVAWGKAGELIAQYMKKGSLIMIQGKLKTSSWDDKDTGKKMYKTEINVRDFQFGRKNTNSTSEAPVANATAPVNATAPQEAPKAVAGATELMDDEINPEDIPF